jgi:hypothetical protein
MMNILEKKALVFLLEDLKKRTVNQLLCQSENRAEELGYQLDELSELSKVIYDIKEEIIYLDNLNQ